MLSSISPLGERARASRWWLTATAYILSSLLGGLAVGAIAGLLGGLAPTGWRGSTTGLLLLAVLLVLGLALDLRIGGLRLPTWPRQVDVEWIGRYRGWVTGVGYGAQLGVGLVTIVTSSTTYAVVLLAAWTGRPGVGALVGGAFGLARALPLLLTVRVVAPADLHRLFDGVERWAPRADVAAKVALGLAAVVVAWLALA
ncbi:membrane hypothetical protein [Nostocoides japonicum T1-X7]|uniref:Urease accessory protein UreH-like transmembrane domain-containing protein n=1 Tax=Nostocoides japonicum T1-X7 TaxID=1194083 RepID=A0A077M539_9MICO|nr:hypothetical protein [Tetrasphaera japonica]CCH79254.1 membrane hypothetical protein [Tetrasphaera japonica T1-X7]